MTRSTYYAHSADGQPWQRLSVHLENTAKRAATFLETVGLAGWGRAAGLLHDVGKYTDQFQARLEDSRRRFDHSAPGARLAIDRYGNLPGKMLAFCIAGHHAGLANGVNGDQITALEERLRGTVSMPDPIWEQEIALPSRVDRPRIKPRNKDTAGFCAAFFIRMVFSALVDADFLDTEAYYAGLEGTPPSRGEHPDLAELSRPFISQVVSTTATSPAARARCACRHRRRRLRSAVSRPAATSATRAAGRGAVGSKSGSGPVARRTGGDRLQRPSASARPRGGAAGRCRPVGPDRARRGAPRAASAAGSAGGARPCGAADRADVNLHYVGAVETDV